MAKLTAILPLRIGNEKEVAAQDPHVDQIMSRDSGGLSTCWIPLKSDSPIKVQDENLPIERMDATEQLSKHYGSKLVAAGMTQAAPGSFIDDESESAVFIEVNRGNGPVDAMVTVIFYAPRP
jgi:hypothetical protein